MILASPTLPIVVPLALLTCGHALYKPSLAVLFGRLRGQSAEARFRLLYLTVNVGLRWLLLLRSLRFLAVAMAPFVLANLLSVVTLATVLILSKMPDSVSGTDSVQGIRTRTRQKRRT